MHLGLDWHRIELINTNFYIRWGMNYIMNMTEKVIRRDNPMALSIVLRRDKNQELTHEQLLLASFSHMALIAEKARDSNWSKNWSIPYMSWREGKFRKIVKRANPQRFDALVEDPEAIHTVIELDGESIELLSFPPYLLTNPDPRVKPLQVSGLNYEPLERFPSTVGTTFKIAKEMDSSGEICLKSELKKPTSSNIVIAYDAILGASTGKMMAQVAHGAQILAQTVSNWKIDSKSIEVVDNFDDKDVDWVFTVTDAGFTEIAPNSTTVKVGVRKLKNNG